ncbi:MAG: lipoprotein-releasing system permease protein [Cyclobacteriaceae bacterium]|jgi:lipoprotein-releasing system permease protein
MLVVGIGTMALIIVLSVFNGLEGLLKNLYASFDPEVYITASEGKSFEYTEDLKQQISSVKGIAIITEVIEDNVLIKYRNAQRVVRMKGVSENYLDQGRIQKSLVYGQAKLREDKINYALIGRGIQYDLSINPDNEFYTLQVYYPKNIRPGNLNPTSLYRVQHLMPAGVFAIEKYYDENYFFAPLTFASQLLQYGNKRTSIEVALDESASPSRVAAQLSELLGAGLQVKLGEEIHQDLYKILKVEKLFVYIIFSLIIGIASINIYFSLTMLAIDKQRDIAILSVQGASRSLISKIFLVEGAIVALTGAFIGLVLGVGVSLIQEKYQLISMGAQTTVMDAYPVKVVLQDVLISIGCIITITLLASIQPARLAGKKISVRTL